MEAKIGKFFESISSFFGVGDQIPWCDRDVIAGCEREVAEANEGASEERKNESIMRLSWALVHSRQSEDINSGIAMLEASLGNAKTPLQQREKLYLLAVGFYRSGEYSKSRHLVEQCLEIAPDWRQALTLKKTVEDQIAEGVWKFGTTLFFKFTASNHLPKNLQSLCQNADGVIGIGITATAVGLIAAGIAAAVSRKN